VSEEPRVSPVMVLADFERRSHTWTREGARSAVRGDGRIRLTLQVLGCKIEWKDAAGSWHPMQASYATRERIALLLEAWLEGKIRNTSHAG
jgi:hypothetical protein